MDIRLLRHATLLLDLGGQRLLVDPMLSPSGALVPIPNSGDPRPIPLVGLPLDGAALGGEGGHDPTNVARRGR